MVPWAAARWLALDAAGGDAGDEPLGRVEEEQDDGHGDDDLLHLIVEIKGYRGEDAKDKKATMETYWVPGVNNLGTYGRWGFAEFTDVFQMQIDFAQKIEAEFNRMIDSVAVKGAD